MLISRVGPPVALNDALRDAHEALAETVRKEIAARKAKGIPLDDETDFEAVKAEAVTLVDAADALDGATLRDSATRVLAMVSGGLSELAPYEDNPEYHGVRVTLRSMTERSMIECREAIAACSSVAEQHDVLSGYVARSVARVEGVGHDLAHGPNNVLEADGQMSPEQMEILDLAGMVKDLWAVVRHYAELPPSKKKHFGSPRPSSSETSTAQSAPPANGAPSDATAALAPGSTSSQSMTPTPVPGATS